MRPPRRTPPGGAGAPPEQPRLRALRGGRASTVSLRPSDQHGVAYTEFMVPAQDAHGHSARVNFRVPPSMVSDVQRIIESRVFPFKDHSAFYRWATYHALLYCDETVESGVSAVTKSITAAYQVEQANLEYREVLDQVSKTINGLLAAGAVDNARRLLRHTQKTIEEMPDPYWRARYLGDLQDRFSHLMRSK